MTSATPRAAGTAGQRHEGTLVAPSLPRVLHVTGGRVYGGIESHLRALALAAPGDDRQGFALAFDGRLGNELRASRSATFIVGDERLRVRDPKSIARARRRLREAIAEWGPDVLLFHGPWSYALLGSRRSCGHRPRVLAAHGARMPRHWADLMTRLRGVDGLTANSAWTLHSYANVFPGVPRGVMHPAVPAPIAAHERARDATRASLGAGDAPVIVLAARMEAGKGHAPFIEALARLETTPWHAWIVGGAQAGRERPYVAALERLIRERGLASRVHLLGQRDDVAALLAAADVYCQPNLDPEPFGVSLVEALWAGRPVVASAAGGPLEIVDDTCGRLVPAGDVASLAGALRSLLEDPALLRTLGAGARPRARALSEPARQRARMLDWLAAVLATRGSR